MAFVVSAEAARRYNRAITAKDALDTANDAEPGELRRCESRMEHNRAQGIVELTQL
jgi:hypothetical protein